MATSGYTIRKVADKDKDAVVGIINYFIENSYANYMEANGSESKKDFIHKIHYARKSPKKLCIG